MKKLLLSVGALALAISAGAQTYFSEDFETGLGAWTLTDSDGDGNDWAAANIEAPQFGHATSASWATNPLTPDNWMISPAIDLTGGTSIALNWKVYAQDQGWADENYTVYVATSATVGALSGSAVNFNEVVGTSAGYMDRSLDLSSFAGQTVYVGFRHHNVTDEFRVNIDDVIVKEVLPDDAAIQSLSIAPIVQAGNISITGTVLNDGTNTINSFDLTYDAGAGLVSETITQTIPAGGTYNFTHGTQLAVSVGTAYSIDVCVDLTGDGDASDDCMTANVGVVSSIPNKKTLGEEKTGTWCQWCPRGAVALAGMEATSSFIGVAVHNGDPMTVTSYDGNIGTYVPGGYPGGGVDRVIDGDPSDFSTMHAARVNEIAPANISVTVVESGSTVDVTVTAAWVMTSSGLNYRLGAIVTEDDVTGSGASWDQVNAYNGGGAGPLTDPITGFDWTTAGSPVPVADFGGYDHVGRALGDDEIIGATASQMTSVTDGTSDSYTYTFTTTAWDLNKTKFIGILSDANTGEVLNAGYATLNTSSIEEKELNSELSIYPNPTVDMTNIKIELEEAANVQIDILNTLGQVVYTQSNENLAAGTFVYQVDVADFAAGIYTVKATVNGQVNTSKLSVK